MSRGESNEYRPEDQSQPSEDDLLSQPLDFDDSADDSASGSPRESEPASDIFSFDAEPAAAGSAGEPDAAGGSGAFLFEPDESVQPASAETPSESADAPPDQWQPQASDEAEWTASPPEETEGEAEPALAFDGEPSPAADESADSSQPDDAAPAFAAHDAEAEASAAEGADAGIPGDLPAGLLGIGAGEQAATEESSETAEQPEEEEKEKKPSLLHRLAEASPYTVILGLSCVAILLACIFLMIELWRYDFDIGAKSGKKLSQAGVAAEWTAPADFHPTRMLG